MGWRIVEWCRAVRVYNSWVLYTRQNQMKTDSQQASDLDGLQQAGVETLVYDDDDDKC